LVFSTSSSFHVRFQRFSAFSRRIASATKLCVSYQTRVLQP